MVFGNIAHGLRTLLCSMANITRHLYAIFLLIAVLYTSAYAEEEAEDETLSTDRNSLTSIRLPSKYLTG
jgi:hypothetical protein